jgi:formate dehydrogenase iron-sulfur subunit
MVALGNQRVAALKTQGYAQAALYDPQGVGGTGVVTVLAFGDHPEWYGGLSKAPRVPLAVTLWKKWLRPIGFLAIFGAIVGAFGHHLYHGNKGHVDPGPVGPDETKG